MSDARVHYMNDVGQWLVGVMNSRADVALVRAGFEKPDDPVPFLLVVFKQGEHNPEFLSVTALHSHSCEKGTFHFVDECHNPEMVPGKCFTDIGLSGEHRSVSAVGDDPADDHWDAAQEDPPRGVDRLRLERDMRGYLWLKVDGKRLVHGGPGDMSEREVIDVYCNLVRIIAATERAEVTKFVV